MDINLRSALTLLALCFFIGCGGSSSQDSDAKHYQQLADSYYAGNTSVADMNIHSAQQFIRYFEHNDLIYAPYIHFPSFNCPEDWNRISCPSTAQENSVLSGIDTESGVFRNSDQENGTTQEPIGRHYEFSCAYSGTFSIEGGIEPFDTGSFNVNFNNCQTRSDITYNGTALLKIITNTKDREESYLLVEQLTAQSNDITILVTGYIYNAGPTIGYSSTKEETISDTYKRYLTYQYPHKSIKQRYEKSARSSYVLFAGGGIDRYYISDSTGYTNSTIYDSELGYAYIGFDSSIDRLSRADLQKQYSLTGDITAEFTFPTDDLVRYSEDTNNDGQQDVGFYFFGLSHFKTSTLTDITLVNLSELPTPPAVRKPYISTGSLTASSVFEASTVYYDDDTLADEVSEYYNWYINGELVAGENSNTLPAFTAVAGDEIQVSIVVTYGTNTIESQRSTVRIVED